MWIRYTIWLPVVKIKQCWGYIYWEWSWYWKIIRGRTSFILIFSINYKYHPLSSIERKIEIKKYLYIPLTHTPSFISSTRMSKNRLFVSKDYRLYSNGNDTDGNKISKKMFNEKMSQINMSSIKSLHFRGFIIQQDVQASSNVIANQFDL